MPLLVPSGADPHGIRWRVLKEGVCPRHEVWVEGIRRAVDRITAGGRHDPHRLGTVHLSGRCHHHPDGGRFAAAGTGTCAADVAESVGAQHEVCQHLVAAVRLRGRRQRPIEGHVARGALDCRASVACIGDLVGHAQGPCGADGDTFSAALALGRVQEQPELRRLESASRRLMAVLRCLGEAGKDVGGLGIGSHAAEVRLRGLGQL